MTTKLIPRVLSRCPRTSRPVIQTLCRQFHSYDHPEPPRPFTSVESAILKAAYDHVPCHGFSKRSMGLGARDAGYLDISPSVLPDGEFSLIRWHLLVQREGLKDKHAALVNTTGDRNSVEEQVAALTWERLMGNKDIIHRWQEALAVMAQPAYGRASIKELALLSDEIWFLAGDRAVDPTWYSKRASLSMIYSSSELFMTNDHSTGFAETRSFLHRRFNEVSKFGAAVDSVGQWVGFTLNAGLNVLRSKGARM